MEENEVLAVLANLLNSLALLLGRLDPQSLTRLKIQDRIHTESTRDFCLAFPQSIREHRQDMGRIMRPVPAWDGSFEGRVWF